MNRIILSVFVLCINQVLLAQESIYIPYRNGDFWGFADTSRNIVVKPFSNNIGRYKNDLFEVGLPDRRGIIHKSGNFILDTVYSNTTLYNFKLIGASKKNEGGQIIKKLFFENGQEITSKNISLESIYLNGELVVVKNEDNHLGLIVISDTENRQFKYLLDHNYSNISVNNETQKVTAYKKEIVSMFSYFDNKLSPLPNQKISYNSKEVPVFDNIPVSKPKNVVQVYNSLVRTNNKLVRINKNSVTNAKKIDTLNVDYNLHSILNISNEKGKRAFVVVSKNGSQFGLLNSEGQLILDTVYASITEVVSSETMNQIYFVTKKNGKWGIVDANKKTLYNFEFDEIKRPVRNNTSIDKGMIVKKNGFVGLLDNKGSEIIPIVCDEIYYERIRGHKSLVLIKDQKFGLFQWEVSGINEDRNYSQKNVLFMPKFEMQPIGMLFMAKFPLVEFRNKKGEILGFGDKKGRIYFEN